MRVPWFAGAIQSVRGVGSSLSAAGSQQEGRLNTHGTQVSRSSAFVLFPLSSGIDERNARTHRFAIV